MNLKNERRDPTIIENGTSAIFKSQFMYYITITHIMSSVVCVCVDMCTRVLGGGFESANGLKVGYTSKIETLKKAELNHKNHNIIWFLSFLTLINSFSNFSLSFKLVFVFSLCL